MSDRHGRATPARPLPDALHDGDERWLGPAVELRDFLDRHGRLPGVGVDAEPTERRLARWVKSQREAERAGRLPARRAAWLDTQAPAWRLARDAAWYATARAVGLHIAETGEYPSAADADAATRRLGTWLRTQRRAQRAGRLGRARIAWLELNLPFWASPADEVWYATAGCVAEFVAEHERMPRADRDGAEGRAARWLRTQRAADRDGRLDDEQLAWLTDAIPGWRSAHDDAWRRTADELARFSSEWGELPVTGGTRPDEHRLACWLGAQRAAAARGTLAASRRNQLDTRVAGWSVRRSHRWSDRLAEAAAFITRHGRLPARTGQADETEQRIAGWIAAQRRADRDGRLDDARRGRLDAAIPGWSSPGEAAWRTRAAELAAFASRHGRLPAVRDQDPAARGLAVWLGRQRSAADAGELIESRERWLRLHVPGWRDHHLGAWLGTAERVVAFRATHGRLPTRGATASAQERELGVWLNNQRSAERAGRLGPERLRWLGEQLPDWRDSRLAGWLERAMEVERYVDEQARMPHPRSTNPRSRQLGGWLETQRAALRAGRLATNRAEWLDTRLPGWDGVPHRAAAGMPNSTPVPTPDAPRTAGAASALAPRPSDERAARVLQEWVTRLRDRDDLELGPEQRQWLDRRLPGWDQRTA